MTVILGIDAAWTSKEPSGVALLDLGRQDSRCIAVAPSYRSFIDLAAGTPVNWSSKPSGGEPDVSELLGAAAELAGREVDLVTIDMPISRRAITGRREADDAVSREFGSRWCAAHSPNGSRPGALGARITEAYARHGYSLATSGTEPGTPRRLLEVYPHPALLALLGRHRRVPYKLSRARRYWPQASSATRRTLLAAEWGQIHDALVRELGPMEGFTRFELRPGLSTAELKAHEDALDAIVSAWVGLLYLSKKAVPLGDDDAAVWCPAAAVGLDVADQP